MHANDKKQKFIELRAAGHTLTAIAKDLQVSKTTIWRWNQEEEEHIYELQAMFQEEAEKAWHQKRLQRLVDLQSCTDWLHEGLIQQMDERADKLPIKEIFLYMNLLRTEMDHYRVKPLPPRAGTDTTGKGKEAAPRNTLPTVPLPPSRPTANIRPPETDQNGLPAIASAKEGLPAIASAKEGLPAIALRDGGSFSLPPSTPTLAIEQAAEGLPTIALRDGGSFSLPPSAPTLAIEQAKEGLPAIALAAAGLPAIALAAAGTTSPENGTPVSDPSPSESRFISLPVSEPAPTQTEQNGTDSAENGTPSSASTAEEMPSIALPDGEIPSLPPSTTTLGIEQAKEGTELPQNETRSPNSLSTEPDTSAFGSVPSQQTEQNGTVSLENGTPSSASTADGTPPQNLLEFPHLP